MSESARSTTGLAVPHAEMLARLLYRDLGMSVYLDWLGLGSLVVVEWGGQSIKAHPMQKKFLLAAASELERNGVALSLSSPVCQKMICEFGHAVLDHTLSSLHWQTAFHVGPQEWARGYLSQ